MKKLLFAVTLAGLMGLGASASEVTSANTFGVLKVASDQEQTIIAVPWVEVGTGSSIKVADLVMTSNLTPKTGDVGSGDMLYYYNGSTYYTWELVEENSVRSWSPVANNVTVSGVTASPGSSEQSVSRGAALILVRKNPTTDIYLYGQYATDSGTTAITAGAWNLIAPSATTATTITGSMVTDGSISDNDYIILSGQPTRKYKYDGTAKKWYFTLYDFDNEPMQTELSIPAGVGAWYVSGGGNPTFQW